MNSSQKRHPIPFSVDDALLAPWAATGRLDAEDARLFAAALMSDPALADDLASARAERDAVVALAGSLVRPSPRVLTALFEAIDAEELGPHVTRLRFDRPRDSTIPSQPLKKISNLR